MIVILEAKDGECLNCRAPAKVEIRISPYPQFTQVIKLCYPCAEIVRLGLE